MNGLAVAISHAQTREPLEIPCVPTASANDVRILHRCSLHASEFVGIDASATDSRRFLSTA